MIGKQYVFLPLNVAPILALKTCIFHLSDFIQGIAEMAHDVEFVEQDGRLRSAFVGYVTKGLPHIHHCKTNAFGFRIEQPVIELSHAALRTVGAAKPDGTTTDQVADYNAIGMSFANRYFVDANGLGCWRSGAFQLRGHVLLVQLLDGVPVQKQFAGNVRHRAGATPSAYIPSKPLGIEWGVGEKVGSFAFHFPAVPTKHPSNFDFQIDTCVATGEVANLPKLLVVPARARSSATVAGRFFERRTSVMIRALESPKMPRIFSSGRKQGNRYASRIRLGLREIAIEKTSHFLQQVQDAFCLMPQGLRRFSC